MPADDLVRMVPILTARDLRPMVAFYEWLGFSVTGDYGDYIVLATDEPSAGSSVEVHLSQMDGHDPATAGAVYVRVLDAPALWQRLHDDLADQGRLFLAPGSGITAELIDELREREEAGEDLVRLHEVEAKPWGLHQFAIIDPAGWLLEIGSPVS